MSEGIKAGAEKCARFMRDHNPMPDSLVEGIGMLVGRLEKSINELRSVVNSDHSQLAKLNKNLEELKKMFPGGES